MTYSSMKNPLCSNLTYGCNADVMSFFSNVSQSSNFQHATNLSKDLQRKRRSLEEKKGPLIFVGHSLGGLVIKDALSKSNEYEAQGRNPLAASIVTSTFGIAFLGTPHWAEITQCGQGLQQNLSSLVLNDCNCQSLTHSVGARRFLSDYKNHLVVSVAYLAFALFQG